MVLERCPGHDLRSLLAEKGAFDPGEATDLLIQVLEVLEEAHAGGIVHGDVRAGHVLRSDTGKVKVLGLGMAVAFADVIDLLSGPVTRQARYASPEQSRGADPEARSDVYAVGVLAYALLSGELPFSARNAMELVRKHRQEAPPALAGDLPGGLDFIVQKALAKSPEARYQTAQEMRQALEVLGIAVRGPRTESVTAAETVEPAVRPEEFFDKLIGTKIDDEFLVLERIGQGGMGAVFRARSELLGNEVALKVIHPDLANRAVARERFLREARAALESPLRLISMRSRTISVAECGSCLQRTTRATRDAQTRLLPYGSVSTTTTALASLPSKSCASRARPNIRRPSRRLIRIKAIRGPTSSSQRSRERDGSKTIQHCSG